MIQCRRELAAEINEIAKILPEIFSVLLTENQKKCLEFEFHSIDYHLLHEIVHGIKNALGIINKFHKELPESCDIQDITLLSFLQELNDDTEDKHELFKCIGIENLKPSQADCFSSLPLVSVFNCLKFFSQWIDSGSYNFRLIPLSFKKHLLEVDVSKLESVRDTWTGNKSKLMDELDHCIEVLKNLEKNIAQRTREQMNVS